MALTSTSLVRAAASLLAAVLVAVHGEAQASPPAAPAPELRAQLSTLAQRRVFFGHAPGDDSLLEGVRQALAGTPDAPVLVVEVQGAAAQLAPGTLAHAVLGQDGEPLSRLEHFAQLMDGGLAAQVDVALFGFAEADVGARTDVQALFARYHATLEALQARHPHVTFVHVTVPLTRVQGGAGGWLKHVLGRRAPGEEENMRREAYNALLRQASAGKAPLFDLAREESTRPDGSPVHFVAGGRTWPALAPAYATGEGHLTPAAQAHLARQLLGFLAALPAPASAPQARSSAR